MNKLGKWLITAGLCMAIAGCGAESSNEEISKAEVSAVETEEEERSIWSEDMKQEEIKFLEEHFSDEKEFQDMDENLAASYGKEIAEFYDFTGRMTEDGIGYVLAFRKGEEDIFESYDLYWKDMNYVAAETDETGQENVVYSLTNISNLYRNDDNKIIYIQPEDFEEPSSIEKAFYYQYCSGDEGTEYLKDVIERKVSFAAPDDVGYLAVYRYENGKRYLEYITLTKEEEEKILNSDALILPEWYGGYGLQYFVSQDVYEETEMEQGVITEEALHIAEERCRYVAMDISEIHDIIAAELQMNVQNEDGTRETIKESLTEETELKELEEIFSASEVYGDGKCPYDGILKLTRQDGKEMVITLATDSCDGFIFGSTAAYTVGYKKTQRIWELFPKVREYTGWALESKNE